MNQTNLEEAPYHIKLAVDLIQLLEEATVSPKTAILALEIVLQDMQSKLSCSGSD